MSDNEIKKLEKKGITGIVPALDVLERIPKSLPKNRLQNK
jgi:hypothetical protein